VAGPGCARKSTPPYSCGKDKAPPQRQQVDTPHHGIRVQRSANLVDREDWRTVTFDGTGCELIDETAASSQRFYRAVEDSSVAVK
jgi:hypothetical protein